MTPDASWTDHWQSPAKRRPERQAREQSPMEKIPIAVPRTVLEGLEDQKHGHGFEADRQLPLHGAGLRIEKFETWADALRVRIR